MPGEDSVAQVVKAGLANLTLLALTVRLSFIEPTFDNMPAATFWASYSFWSAQLAHSLVALFLVDQGLEVNQYRGGQGLESSQSSSA